MRRGQKEAQTAVRNYLSGRTEPVLLYSVSCVADEAARGRRQTDLFPSLFDYEVLLPADWTARWLGSTGSSDSMCYATPRDWQPGKTQSQSLLMSGKLTHVRSEDFAW